MNKRIYVLTMGAFVIGTEGFLIAGVLPLLAKSFHVSLSVAGQLVTVFSLVYAVGSPVLATLTGRWDRRRVLVAGMLVFAAGNAIAALSNAYAVMAIGRIVAGIGAGWYSPAATASAAALVRPDQRGRAISSVVAGQTVALMLGVPIGTWIALTFQWRTSFWILTVVGVLAALLIRLRFPAIPSPGAASMRERLAPLKRPELLSALLTTLAWAIGIFAVYTYVADIFAGYGAADRTISLVLFVAGAASLIGVKLGGFSTDRFGSPRTIAAALPALALSMAVLSIVADFASPSGAGIFVAVALGIAALALWGASGYAFNPAQQHRLIDLSGPAAGVILSLSSSATYLGSALGASTGGLVVRYGSAGELGYYGAGWELLALALFAVSLRLASMRLRRTARMPQAEPIAEDRR